MTSVAEAAARVERAVMTVRGLEEEISRASAALVDAQAEVVAAREALFVAFPELRAEPPRPSGPTLVTSEPLEIDDPDGAPPVPGGPIQFKERIV